MNYLDYQASLPGKCMGMGVDDESERGAKLHCGPRTWDDALGRRRHCRSNSLERICRCLAADEPSGKLVVRFIDA
jgi:hypothetical protein